MTKSLGASMEQLQSAFDKSVNTRFAPLQAALKPVPGVEKLSDPDALKGAYATNQSSYRIALAYGRALASAKDKAAFEALERAAKLVPVATGEESPHALMAQLAEQLGDEPRALSEYQVRGVSTTLPFFRWLTEQPAFATADFHTAWLDGVLAERKGAPFVEAR